MMSIVGMQISGIFKMVIRNLKTEKFRILGNAGKYKNSENSSKSENPKKYRKSWFSELPGKSDFTFTGSKKTENTENPAR